MSATFSLVVTFAVMLMTRGLAATVAISSDRSNEAPIVMAMRPSTVIFQPLGDPSLVQIDLHYCGEECLEGDCGEWMMPLCGGHRGACRYVDGAFEVTVPESIPGMGLYKVRVTEGDGQSAASCSPAFTLVDSDADSSERRPHAPSVKVSTPFEGDQVSAGDLVRLQITYDDGRSLSGGRFKIDLYGAKGTEDCGSWAYPLCDNPLKGCMVQGGFYDVMIPIEMASDFYSIRVGLLDDAWLFDCSPVFKIQQAESLSFADEVDTTFHVDLGSTQESTTSFYDDDFEQSLSVVEKALAASAELNILQAFE